MSGFALNIRVTRNTPALEAAKLDSKAKRALMAVRGKRLEKDLRAHFLQKNGEPNKRGWGKSNFWARRIRANTSLTEINETFAVVDIAAPEMALKVYGGTVKPKESKALAIPAREEAYGRSPRLFDDLHFVPQRSRRGLVGYLVRNDRTDVNSREESGGEVMYFLMKSVKVPRDKTALPTAASIQAADRQETEMFFARRAARAARTQTA